MRAAFSSYQEDIIGPTFCSTKEKMTPEPSASTAPTDHSLPPTASEPPRKRRHRWIWAVVLILFGLLFYWVFTMQRKSQAAATGGGRRGLITGPVPVVPATATVGNLGVYLDAIGTVTPVYTDTITAQVTGVITDVHFREGQFVHKGDALVDIDPRPYAAQLTEAQGALERDQNLLAEAQMDLQRYQEAWKKNAIPRQTLEDQEKLVLQDQGTVKNDEGTVQYDQVQLDYCHIASPISGRVGLRLADPGNLITANSTNPLVVVTQLQPITVIFTLAEGDLQQVLDQMRHGKQLSVEAWDSFNSEQLGSGRLTTIDNLIDTTTGTVKLRATFPNANDALFPNQFVNTRLLVTTLTNQILVPSSAVQHNGDQAFVYLIEAGAGHVAGSAAPGGTNAGGATAPSGEAAGQGGHASRGGAGGQSGAGQHETLYHVVQTNVKEGVTDRGMTAVEGIQPGNIVANSTFDKLVSGATVFYSKTGIPETQTTISGESSAP
jgi:membrane fusion protein, multidrug efflux system